MKRDRLARAAVYAVVSLVATSCSLQGDEVAGPEESGADGEALIAENALNMNALNMNALNMNGLEFAALSISALTPGNLTAIRDPTSTGDLARQLVRYAVSCAFDATQSFSFSWTDSRGVVRNETYWGQLALDTGWAVKPLSNSGQRWVSACLASRVNWYGVSVTISARGGTGGLNVTDPGELNAYTHEEGAFYGNLFGSNPALFSCNIAINDAYSRDQYRDCAAGHLVKSVLQDCGMLRRLGSCNTLCSALNSLSFHPSCYDSAGSNWHETVTVFLQ
ncbi:hypothetical protein [Sorangium sp. So ce124]|uniref:hypothetical protein n=1 Tax=Sorangium sp. So ce124 TaxID=3133280 RepID=UPI003F5FD06E